MCVVPYLVEPAAVLEQDSSGDDVAVTFTVGEEDE